MSMLTLPHVKQWQNMTNLATQPRAACAGPFSLMVDGIVGPLPTTRDGKLRSLTTLLDGPSKLRSQNSTPSRIDVCSLTTSHRVSASPTVSSSIKEGYLSSISSSRCSTISLWRNPRVRPTLSRRKDSLSATIQHSHSTCGSTRVYFKTIGTCSCHKGTKCNPKSSLSREEPHLLVGPRAAVHVEAHERVGRKHYSLRNQSGIPFSTVKVFVVMLSLNRDQRAAQAPATPGRPFL